MKELSFEQMECISGGGWVHDALAWVGNALSAAWDFAKGLAGSFVFSYYSEYIPGQGQVYGVTITGYY